MLIPVGVCSCIASGKVSLQANKLTERKRCLASFRITILTHFELVYPFQGKKKNDSKKLPLLFKKNKFHIYADLCFLAESKYGDFSLKGIVLGKLEMTENIRLLMKMPSQP